MTKDEMTLQGLLEKSSDAGLLREMIGFYAQRLMKLETDVLCGAAHGERSPDRINQPNGLRDRNWETRAGTSTCASRNYAKAVTSRTSLSHAGRRRRRWPR
jgi:putative transposase